MIIINKIKPTDVQFRLRDLWWCLLSYADIEDFIRVNIARKGREIGYRT